MTLLFERTSSTLACVMSQLLRCIIPSRVLYNLATFCRSPHLLLHHTDLFTLMLLRFQDSFLYLRVNCMSCVTYLTRTQKGFLCGLLFLHTSVIQVVSFYLKLRSTFPALCYMVLNSGFFFSVESLI